MEDPAINELTRRVMAFESGIDADCLKSSSGIIRTASIWLGLAIISWVALITLALH